MGGTRVFNPRIMSPSYRAGWAPHAAWGTESTFGNQKRTGTACCILITQPQEKRKARTKILPREDFRQEYGPTRPTGAF